MFSTNCTNKITLILVNHLAKKTKSSKTLLCQKQKCTILHISSNECTSQLFNPKPAFFHHSFSNEQFNDELTYECNHQDAEEDPEGVTEDVHHHDGEQGHGQVGLTLPLVTLAAAQNLQ